MSDTRTPDGYMVDQYGAWTLGFVRRKCVLSPYQIDIFKDVAEGLLNIYEERFYRPSDEYMQLRNSMTQEEAQKLLYVLMAIDSEKHFFASDTATVFTPLRMDDEAGYFDTGKTLRTFASVTGIGLGAEYSRASDDSFDSSNLSELQMTEEEQLSVEEQVERKAEDLLVDMGLNGFRKYRSEWKRLRVYEINNGIRTLEETGDYSLWLRYMGSYGNVPVADMSILGSMGEIPLCKTQYVDLLYTCEGELLELKNIGLDTYEAEKEEEFFLPFESVTQIFEQYCRTFYTEERVNEMMGTGISMDGGKLHGRFHITVDDVRLEYRPVYPERKSDQEERLESGILTPVWNFYGKTEWNPVQKTEGEGSTVSLPQQLLLSVNACDGQVYGR